MLLFAPNLLFFCFIVASGNGEAILEIIKNDNGIKYLVLSFMEARNGTNFSLECQVIDSKSGEKLNDQIVWKKTNWKSKFASQVHDIKMLKNTIIGATMTFITVSEKNQGQYVCISPNYKLTKIIFIKVRPEYSTAKVTSHPLIYVGGRRKRSNGVRDTLQVNKNSRISSNLDEFPISDEKKALDEFEHNQWDVKKVKLNEDNDTETNIVRYHDGTTDIFRIGLIVSFALLAMVGIYRIFKCWRTGTLGPLNNRVRASSVTPNTQNNSQDICASNQTTITTCTVQNENTIGWSVGPNCSVNGINQNDHIESPLNLTMRQQVTFPAFSGQNNFDMDDFNARFENLGNNC